MRFSTLFLCIFGSLIVALYYTARYTPNVPADTAEWQLPADELRLDQALFLGAHNALISRDSTTNMGTFLYAQQTWNLHEQLAHGVRVFELDLGFYNDQLCISHKQARGIYRLQRIGSYESFQDIMRVFKTWFAAHPREIIIILIDNRDPHTPCHQLDNELAQMPHLSEHILMPHEWDPYNHDGFWPTLGWLRDHHKQLIIFNDRKDDSPQYTYHHWEHVMCTPPHTAHAEHSLCLRLESQKHNAIHAQLYQLNHFAGIADHRVSWLYSLSVILATHGWYIPDSMPSSENKVDEIKKLIALSKQKNLARGKNPNFIMFDNVDRFIAQNGMAFINECNKKTIHSITK